MSREYLDNILILSLFFVPLIFLPIHTDFIASYIRRHCKKIALSLWAHGFSNFVFYSLIIIGIMTIFLDGVHAKEHLLPLIWFSIILAAIYGVIVFIIGYGPVGAVIPIIFGSIFYFVELFVTFFLKEITDNYFIGFIGAFVFAMLGACGMLLYQDLRSRKEFWKRDIGSFKKENPF